MNEEELKREIEVRKQAVRERGITKKDMKEYEKDGFSKESWWDGDIMILEAELRGFQKGKLQAKKEELEFLEDCFREYKGNRYIQSDSISKLKNRIKQLQKEISEDGK